MMGSAAKNAEERKMQRYASLRFEPLAIKTAGVYGQTTALMASEIGRRITGITGDKRETHWLRQRLSMAVARGNAASVLATAEEEMQ